MKFSRIAIATCSLLFVLSSHADVSKNDREFLTKAAAGGLYEVEAGKLAQTKGSDAEVKAYGAMLVKDHGAANEELKALASSKGVTVPASVPADKQSRLEKISKAKNFDKEFVDEVGMEDHKKDISLFEKASKNADDAQVKAFASKTLPTLKAHHEHAQNLKKSLKN